MLIISIFVLSYSGNCAVMIISAIFSFVIPSFLDSEGGSLVI